MLILFSYARIIWIRVAPSENQVHVAMAGKAIRINRDCKRNAISARGLKDHREAPMSQHDDVKLGDFPYFCRFLFSIFPDDFGASSGEGGQWGSAGRSCRP